MKIKYFILNNPPIKLTSSYRKNIKALKSQSIDFWDSKDQFTNQKMICFKSYLLESDIETTIQIYKALIPQIILSFNDYGLSYDKVNEILIHKYGLPDDCNDSADVCYFNTGSCQLVHTLNEVRMGCYEHYIDIIFHPVSHLLKTKNYPAYKKFKDQVNACISNTYMKVDWLSYRTFPEISLFMSVSCQTQGIYFIGERKSATAIPFDVSTYVEDGRKIITKKPRSDKKVELIFSSSEDLLLIICNYLKNL
jgi:hypothetical protein